MTRITVLWIATILAVCVIMLTGCLKRIEDFTFATDVCESINPDSDVYNNSPKLQELCNNPDIINPNETCLVDCDVDTLCRNYSVGYCRKPRGSNVLCDVTDNYYGSHPENIDLPKIYRMRRGTCLVATVEGAFVDDTNLRKALLRFPKSIAMVDGNLRHETEFANTWTVSITSSLSSVSSDLYLPLISDDSHDFVKESTDISRKYGVSYHVPTALLHESCVSPGDRDTSVTTEPTPLQDRLNRASNHENQPPVLHITAKFTLSGTTSAKFGGDAGLVYQSLIPGQTGVVSPVSGVDISVRTEVWLMLEISPKDMKLLEAREVIVGSDGRMHISKSGMDKTIDVGSFIDYSGDAPKLWLGMRDAALDIELT